MPGMATMHGRTTNVDKGYTLVNRGRKVHFLDHRSGSEKVLTFDPESFTGWMSLLYYQGTVFQMGVVKYVCLGTALTGFTVALIVAQLSTADHKVIEPTPLKDLADFLMIFLSFMTGLFVNGAFMRWQEILAAYFDVSEALKNLYSEVFVQGCPRESLGDIRRWGLISLWLAARETPEQWTPPHWEQDIADMLNEGWTNSGEISRLFSKEGKKAHLPWAWIVMKLRELSEQGLAPATQTPAMVRMMDHCHFAIAALSNVENLALFQVPYQYMHMLAILIHFFNIINAIRCGINLGHEFAEWRFKVELIWNPMLIQAFFVNITYMLAGPIMYQASISIAADIMIPFGSGTCDIPVRFLVDQFHHELNDIDEFYRNPAPGTPWKEVKTSS